MTSAVSAQSSFGRTSPTLLARIAAKDPAAWQTLVDLYGPLVLYWIRRQGLSEHDAAEAAQGGAGKDELRIVRAERLRDPLGE